MCNIVELSNPDAPGIIDGQSLFEPLQTGVLSMNSMIPLARGKPDLIFIVL